MTGRKTQHKRSRPTHKWTTAPLEKTVLVKFAKPCSHSPHVVDLKKPGVPAKWEVSAFQEKPAVKQSWVKADFAEMVRKANYESRLFGGQARIMNHELKIKTKIKNTEVKQILNKYYTKIIQKFSSFSFKFPDFQINYRKLAYCSVALFLLVTLPFPATGYYNKIKDDSAKAVEESTNAFLALQSSTVAAFQANIPQAEHDLNIALNSFGNADDILSKEHQALVYVASLVPVVGREISGRQRLLEAGHYLALGNTYLVKGVKESEDSKMPMTDRINLLAEHLRGAIPHYQKALENLSAVDMKIVPVEYQKSFSEFKLLFAGLIDDLNDLTDLSQMVDSVFGGEQLKRYLLAFQNNNELRPTGGFMGSFAVLDIQKGKIMGLDLPGGGTYDLQGQLDVFVKPPLPMQLVNTRWEFQDSNWFPDFSASAKKTEWFYEHGRGSTVDGVIAINASVLERLLKVIGPLENQEHGLQLSNINALDSLQSEIEKNKEKNQPKEVLIDLAEQFLNQMSSLKTTNVIRLLAELNEALAEKEIQLYFNDNSVQQLAREFGWTGELTKISAGQDYLAVVGANLQGQKSDAKIKQVIEHQAVVKEDGSIVDTVIIHRKHLGIPGEPFYGVNNIQYLRVYVPLGSQLLSAGGFSYPPEDAFKVPENWYKKDIDLSNYEKEIGIHAQSGTRITEEFGKTAFGNWAIVAPGEATSIYFTYRLPFKSEKQKTLKYGASEVAALRKILIGQEKNVSHYSLLVQKQSGTKSDFYSRIIYPENWSPVWQENSDLELAGNGAEFSTILNNDTVIGLVMQENIK